MLICSSGLLLNTHFLQYGMRLSQCQTLANVFGRELKSLPSGEQSACLLFIFKNSIYNIHYYLYDYYSILYVVSYTTFGSDIMVQLENRVPLNINAAENFLGLAAAQKS